MRLTLRTLLAWLDSLLSPLDHQELAEKIAASPVAPKLVRRIQDAVENPGLGVPRIDARGLADDANSVAEYLDNCLAADRLEEFERICIESDMHLAEVASCHGMLAEMSRDPGAAAPLDDAARTRLLAAVRDHVATQQTEETIERTVRPQPGGSSRARRPPLGAWVSAAVAVALLLGLTTIFVRSLVIGPDRRVAMTGTEPTRRPAAVFPAPVGPPPADAAVPRPAEPTPPRDERTPSQRPDPVAVKPPPANGVERRTEPDAATPLPAEPTVPAAEPAVSAGTPPAAAATDPSRPTAALVPQGDALAIAAPPAVAEPPRKPPQEQPPAVAPAPAAPAAVVTGTALLLHRPPVGVDAVAQPVHGTTGWAVLPPGTVLAAREDLIAPPASRPEITAGTATIRLEPDSRVTLTRDADGTPRIELVFGRIAVRAAADVRFGLTAGGLSGVVMSGLEDPVGAEVVLEREPGAAAGDSNVRATIATTAVPGGGRPGIVWRQTEPDGSAPERPLRGLQAQGMLEAGRRIVWESRDPDVAATLPASDLEWIVSPARIDRLDAVAIGTLQARLAAGQPFEKTLRDAAADRREREENRALAAATLALVGDYDELARLLCAESSATGVRGGRWRKLEQSTVPLALARGVNAAERLNRSFEEHAPAGRAGDLVALARGVTDAELAAGADARLVEGLDAPELVVRRYAHRNLADIVPQAESSRVHYDSDRSSELRREAVAWWRKQLETGRIRRAGATVP